MTVFAFICLVLLIVALSILVAFLIWDKRNPH